MAYDIVFSFFGITVGFNATGGGGETVGDLDATLIAQANAWTDVFWLTPGYKAIYKISNTDGGVTAVLETDTYGIAATAATWEDVYDVFAGETYCIGMLADLSFAACGDDTNGIVTAAQAWDGEYLYNIACGREHCIGLFFDSTYSYIDTVVAVGDDTYGQVSGINSITGEIIGVAAGDYHSVALLADGTVVAVGDDTYGQVSGTVAWTEIETVVCGANHTIGVKSDGTILGCGDDTYGQVSGATAWSAPENIAASGNLTYMQQDGASSLLAAVGDDTHGAVTALILFSGGTVGDVAIPVAASVPGIFVLTLTGDADGTTDVALPCSNLYARLRSGSVSYLQCVIPYTSDFADAVSARSNGDLSLNYVDAEGEHTVVVVALETVQISRGTKNNSIVVTGHRQSTNSDQGSHTLTAISVQTGSTTNTLTVPGYAPEVRPADNVTAHGVTIAANLVSIQASVSARRYTVQTVYSEGS